MRMIQMDIATFALSISSGDHGPVIATVPRASREASSYMIGAKADGLSPMILLADCDAVSAGGPSLSSLTAAHSLVAWGRRHLPNAWMSVEGGPIWISMNGANSFHLLLVDAEGLVTCCKLKWPFEREGSFGCLVRAFPAYAGAFVNILKSLYEGANEDSSSREAR